MNTKMIEINNEVNRFLQSGLKLAQRYEKQGQKEEARLILRITSDVVHKRIQSSGLQESLTEFWNNKKGIAYEQN